MNAVTVEDCPPDRKVLNEVSITHSKFVIPEPRNPNGQEVITPHPRGNFQRFRFPACLLP